MSSHTASDSGMYKMMGVVLGAICVLTLFIAITARMLSSGSNDEFDSLLHNAMMQRIAPAATVRTEAPVATAVAAVAAPKGSMPARGGSDYSDEEIARAVEWMTGLGSGAAAEPDSAAAATTTTETSGAATAAAVSTTTEAAADASSAGVIAALTPRIKNTVDAGICAGCHLSGVANAPKYGDSEAWAKRAEAGFAALAQSVANGKGAMPPRGGSDLTDDELLIAVEYMVNKGS